MLIVFVFVAVLLRETVLGQGNDCSETFTSPGNISTTTATANSVNLYANPQPIYCVYYINAPTNFVIELNFTRLGLLQKNHASVSSSSSSQSRSRSDSSSSSQQKQSAPTALPPSHEDKGGERRAPVMHPTTTTDCLPNIDVVEVTSQGREITSRRLCLQQNDLSLPQVFRSDTHLIKVNYSWEAGQSFSFELSFMFHKWPSGPNCAYRCHNGVCLPDTSLVCNNVADCSDESDESDCAAPNGNNHFIEVAVIVIVIVFTIGVVACVFFHYRLTTRLWQDRRRESSSTEHHHLSPHSTQSTEVVYVPGAPMDRIERAAALQRERQIRLQAIQTDIELNLPPAISISEDGEEGYTHSQRVLQMSREEWPGGSIRVIRPPPNKTVFQGDSPPPYRSNSVNKLDGHYCNKKNSGAGTHHYPGQTYLGIRLACSGNNSPQIARCHSMSAGEQRPLSYSSQNSCPSGAVVCGHYHIPRDSHGASRSYCNGAQSLTHTCHSNHLHSASSQGSTAPAHGPAQNVSVSGSPNPHFTALHAVAHNRIVCPQAGAAHSHADLMNTATSQTKSEPGCHGDDLDNQDLGCDYIEPPPNYSDVVRVSSSKTQSAITSVKQLTETSSKEPSSSV